MRPQTQATATPWRPPPHQFTDPTASGRPPQAQPSTLPLMLTSFLTLLFSIPFIVVGIWLAARHHADCVRFLEWPFLILGIVLLLVSLLGLLGAATRNHFLLVVYMFLLIVIILLLLAFTIFAFVVTTGSKGHRVTGAAFKEYRPEDYSDWMRNKVSNFDTWTKVKDCLRHDGVCARMNNNYPNASIFYRSKLAYVESGCCKPPSSCCFTYVNATTWNNPLTPNNDIDCSRWSNDPNQLCYDCNSCHAAVIRNLNKDWRKAADVAIAFLVLLILLYLVAFFILLRLLPRMRAPYRATGMGRT